VDAQQLWKNAAFGTLADEAIKRATCVLCSGSSYWVQEHLVWPSPHLGPAPNEDLHNEVLELYNEARAIAPRSPRAAAALLRLLVERLADELGADAGTLAERINQLATSGVITQRTIDALTAVRLTGNSAVHAGQIDPSCEDDVRVVLLLFTIVNSIAENALTLPRRTHALIEAHKPGTE
jgi:hypothetical protein